MTTASAGAAISSRRVARANSPVELAFIKVVATGRRLEANGEAS